MTTSILESTSAATAPCVPEGWSIVAAADGSVLVRAPLAGPGGTTVRADRGSLEARLLHALASALLLQAAPPASRE